MQKGLYNQGHRGTSKKQCAYNKIMFLLLNKIMNFKAFSTVPATYHLTPQPTIVVPNVIYVWIIKADPVRLHLEIPLSVIYFINIWAFE